MKTSQFEAAQIVYINLLQNKPELLLQTTLTWSPSCSVNLMVCFVFNVNN